jgi:hypothetical protein
MRDARAASLPDCGASEGVSTTVLRLIVSSPRVQRKTTRGLVLNDGGFWCGRPGDTRRPLFAILRTWGEAVLRPYLFCAGSKFEAG